MRDGKLINVNQLGRNRFKYILFFLKIRIKIILWFLLIILFLNLIFLNIVIDDILKKYKMLIKRKTK